MNSKITARQLKQIFLDSFSMEKEFQYEQGNPFLIVFEQKEYHVFLKTISSAHYPKYPDITRIQLPYSPHFKRICNSAIPFIILGYDKEHLTFSGWEPYSIKKRLNAKRNVSLFSRKSFQEEIPFGAFKKQTISNGDQVIIFSQKSTPQYFKQLDSLFDRLYSSVKENLTNKNNIKSISKNVISKIFDSSVLEEVNRFKKNNDLIGAVIFCDEKYSKDFPGVNIKTWTLIINEIFRNNKLPKI